MSYEDKTIVCADCSAEFPFTANEQQLFAERGFTSEPKRCKPCRDARKGAGGGNRDGANYATSSSSSYGGGGGGGGGYGNRGGGGGGRSGGGSFGGPKQMFPATCASCNKQTEVPFKPSGSRPVYCRDCFQQQGNGR